MSKFRTWSVATLLLCVSVIPHAAADERRAPAPKFDEKDLRGIFFENLTEALSGPRPKLASMQKSAPAVAVAVATSTPGAASGSDGGGKWDSLITPVSIEDEIKRIRNHFDSVVTTPGDFNGGGYKAARVDLSALAMLFAVISEYGGDVRWKDQAAAARNLLARTAFNCKAGSTQVYNEAKLRKTDLQDLISGGGLSSREAEPETDWSAIVDRSPLMEYAKMISESLKDLSANESSVKSNPDQIRRDAELLSVLGRVLIQEGMDDWDDEEYATFSKSMSTSSSEVSAAIQRGDADAVRKGVGAITQSCDACHADYR